MSKSVPAVNADKARGALRAKVRRNRAAVPLQIDAINQLRRSRARSDANGRRSKNANRLLMRRNVNERRSQNANRPLRRRNLARRKRSPSVRNLLRRKSLVRRRSVRRALHALKRERSDLTNQALTAHPPNRIARSVVSEKRAVDAARRNLPTNLATAHDRLRSKII